MLTVSFEFPLFLTAIIANVALAVIVALYAPKNNSRHLFVAFVSIQILWAVTNYLAFLVGSEYFLQTVRLVMFFASLHSLFFLLFISSFFSENNIFRKTHVWIVVALEIVIGALVFSPYIFSMLDKNGLPVIGAGMPFFGIFVFGNFLWGFILLVRKYTTSNDGPKTQAKYLLVGFLLTLVLIFLFAFLGYVIFKNVELVRFSHLYTLPFVIFTAYVMIRHDFMNIKPLLAELGIIFLVGVLFFNLLNSQDVNSAVLNLVTFMGATAMSMLVIRGVWLEVEQRQKIEQIAKELTEANKHLREMDRQKSEFVSIASHQLRTPLTAIKGYSSMLLEGSFGKLEKKSYEAVDRILESSKRLVNIIEDFLNLTRIEQGRLSYEFGTVEMKKLVKDVMEDLKPRADEKKLSMSFKADHEGNYFVTGDYGKLTQIVSNLVDNSIKYTPTGHVNLLLTHDRENRKITFCVEDSGVGIAKEDVGNLFKKFSRGGANGGRKLYTEGTGLGLFVAEQMIQAHRGRIWCESEGEGKGSKFFVELMAEK